MTKITFKDGKPVLRGGKVGTGQGCCCKQGCPRCVRNGEIDCKYRTEAACEECVRTYTCQEARQTECDGDCPEGFTPGEPVRVVVSHTPGCQNFTGYGTTTAYGIATVGCGQILSVALDPDYHDGLGPPTGFARLGRVAPTITATVTQSGGSASGAVLAVELGESTDDCGLPYWFIFGISVVSPGSGYTIFEPSGNAEITIAAAPGDTDEGYGALAWVSDVDEDGGILGVYIWYGGRWYRNSTTAPPILTPVTVAIDNEGSGAVVTPVVDTNTSSPTFGHITGFTVANGGSGYVSLCTRSGPVASCDECPPLSSPESAECIVASEEGPCGEWQPGFPCDEPCHECDSVGVATPECPNFQTPCEQVFPDAPYNCCEIDGERRCKPWACYPGATIRMQFMKKVGCEASGNDPNNILGFVDEGEEFELVIDGGSIFDCSDSVQISGAPCLTQWTLSTGCVVSELTCDTSTGPNPQAAALCQSCAEFLGWSSCRNDCGGGCV